MKKFTLNLKMCLGLCSCLILMAFSAYVIPDEQIAYLQKKLTEHYDNAREEQDIKHYELNVTNRGFCRYKRYFNNGKIEYFSFNLLKFKSLDYDGAEQTGKLFFRTKGEDVIVQTYNDKEGGDVDTMATYLALPVKNMMPEDLTELSEKLLKMTAQLQAQK